MKRLISNVFMLLLAFMWVVPIATAADTTAPVISQVVTVPNDALSFYVYVQATDDVSVSSVQFPTWTNYNSQDDLASPWPSGTSGNWTIDGVEYNWRYLVNIKDHNYEAGDYIIHIYAYDAAGNQTTRGTSYNFVHASDSEDPVISRMTAVQNGTQSFYVYAYASDNVYLKDMVFKAWSGTTEADDDLVEYGGAQGNWTIDGQSYNWCCLVSSMKHNGDLGKYSVQAVAYDLKGNVGTSAIEFEFSADVSSDITFNLDGVDYVVNTLIERQEGPGIIYRRLRVPDFPLNINLLEVDLNNEYNRVETFRANEQLYATVGGTETLAKASARYTTSEKRVIGGANGNFWCVSSQFPWADCIVGTPLNGSLRNGKIITETNNASDKWCAVPYGAGMVTISPDKKLTIDNLTYGGAVVNEKIGRLDIQMVNKFVRDGEIGLYNSWYGTAKTFMPVDAYTESGVNRLRVVSGVTTEVYLNLVEGQKWLAGQSMECVVQEVKTDAINGTLGNYDLCLVGRGANKDVLAQLSAGDKVMIDISWLTPSGEKPLIEQAIGGNSIVMLDGKKTGGNDNQDYNYKTYSRCAYGSSADGKKLIIIVIDKSIDPVYGQSIGCNTRVMCDIASFYGCDDLCNVDAGGSAQMLVNGSVVNKTTEATARAVSDGWFVYSVAPQDDVTITRLEFADMELVAPPYSSFTPKLIGYNQYGDLIDEDVQGFTLSCDPAIGTTEGDTFIAGGNANTGNLTATLNGVSVSKAMTIEAADLAIRVKPLLIDAVREYPIEVTAQIDETIYTYDPSRIAWTIGDASIISIDANGVLRGQKEGSTSYSGTIGTFTDETDVTVEIAGAPKLYPSDYTGWTIKSASGITKGALAEDGTLSYTYGSPRSGAYVQMAKDIVFYSLPDKLWLTFTSSVDLTSITVDLRAAINTRANAVEIQPTSGDVFAAGETYAIELPISALGDPADMILYPVSLHYIKFGIKLNSANKGAQTIKITELSAEYQNYSGTESIVNDAKTITSIYPNPVTDGMFKVVSADAIEMVQLFTASGHEVLRENGNGLGIMTIDVAQLSGGLYFAKVMTASGSETIKLIIK